MGQTPKYGLRFPEREDPAEAWTAVGNLAADVETMYQGVGSVATPADGWAWYGAGGYGDGVTIRAGRVVTIDGLLKRTGPPLTLSASPATPVPLLTVTHVPDRAFTGMLFNFDGRIVRWIISANQGVVQVMHPGGTGAYTFATNAALAVAIRYVVP
jgi:hypothetical protein